MKTLRPQKGFQENMLRSSADIVIGGSAAGVGKTFGLLLDPLYHVHNPKFGGVIFRRTSPQIRAEGGLWDTSMSIYSLLGATPKQSVLEWVFPSGCKLKFSHLEHEKNKLDWQGSQITFIGFDELTHFSESMFFYLLSRNRSTCGVKPYIRATCNPDPESWVAELVRWWVCPETGLPIPEREGKIRFFARDGRAYIWGDTEEEVYERAKYFIDPAIEKSKKADFELSKSDFIKSLTFISGSIYENTELLKVNPSYLSNLMALPETEKACLLDGNWKVRISDLDLFNYHKFGDIFTNSFVPAGKKCITADIALKGSDRFVVFAWDGFRIVDAATMSKSDGKQIVDTIEGLAKKHSVPHSNIVYDNDGVGGFIDGFIDGAKPFRNGATAENGENYKNLKAQCYYRSADRVNAAGVYVTPGVAAMKVTDEHTREELTIEDLLKKERGAVKRARVNDDGKLCINSKDDQKTKLGRSPDFLDAFMMREMLDLDVAARVFDLANLNYFEHIDEDRDDLRVNAVKIFEDNSYCDVHATISAEAVYITDVVYNPDAGVSFSLDESVYNMRKNETAKCAIEVHKQHSFFINDLKNCCDTAKYYPKFSSSNQPQRVTGQEHFIKNKFYFQSATTRIEGSDYHVFMRSLEDLTRGRNQHSRAADTLAFLSWFLRLQKIVK